MKTNPATNTLRVGHTARHGEATRSQTTGDMGEILMALLKMTGKIERSGICLPVGCGSGQATQSFSCVVVDNWRYTCHH